MKKSGIKRTWVISIIFAVVAVSVHALQDSWGDKNPAGVRESSSSGIYTPGRYAFDGKVGTWWATEGNESWAEYYVEDEEDFYGATVSLKISEGAELRFYYEKNGIWISYGNGVIKGPVEGVKEVRFSEEQRKTRRLLVTFRSKNPEEDRVNEIELKRKADSREWGRIEPESYSFNQNEYINIKPERLWDGYIKETWYEPLWYVQWEIQQSKDYKAGIFAPYNGIPTESGEIIWELDGKYKIETIKAYFEAGWRHMAFDFWDGEKWTNRREFYGNNATGWHRLEIDGQITTDRIRMTFPSGWENARFINQIEIWGEGERKNTTENILVTRNKDGSYTAVIDEDIECSEFEITTGKGNGGITVEFNSKEYKIDSARLETAEEKTYIVHTRPEDFRNGFQYIKVNSEGKEVHEVVVRKRQNIGKIGVAGYYGDGYYGKPAGTEAYEYEKTFTLDRKYQIERIKVYAEEGENLRFKLGEDRDVLEYFEYEGNGEWSKKVNGIECSAITIESDKEFDIQEVEIYGSPAEDLEVPVEMWSLSESVDGNSCIIGWKGSRESKVLIDGNINPRQEGNLFWMPVSEAGKEYLDRSEHTVRCSEGNIWSEKRYSINEDDDTEVLLEQIKQTGLAVSIDIPYGNIITQSEFIDISGRCGNGEKIKVYVNGEETEVQNGKYSKRVYLEEGIQRITVRAEDVTGRNIYKDVEVTRDSIKPEIKMLTPTEGEYSNTGKILFTADGQEEGLWWQFNDEEWEKGDGRIKFKTYYLEDGFYEYNLRAQDRAGNISENESVRFCMDQTPPNPFNIRMNIEGWSNNNTPVAEFKTDDATSGISHYEYSIDGKPFIRCESPLEIGKLEDGIRILKVNAVDRAGNIREEEVRLYIDTSVPPQPIKARPVSSEKSIVVKWIGEDDNSIVNGKLTPREGNRSYRIERSPQWKDGIRELRDYGYGELQYEDEEAEVGNKYSYRIWSVDRAGNQSEASKWRTAMAGLAVAEINNDGDTVAEFDGMTVTLPKGAVAEDIISIQINKIADADVKEKPLNPVVGSTYLITAVRQNDEETYVTNHAGLKEDAVIEIAYNPKLIPGSYTNSEIAAFYYDDVWGSWMRMKDANIDTIHNNVIFRTNHFTEFSVQATKKVVLSESEVRESAYSLSSEKINQGEVRVSGENGGASLEFTEYVMPGKNGMDFAVKRVYSTAQAYSDAAGNDTQKIDGESIWRIANGWKMNMPYMSINGDSVIMYGTEGHSFDSGQMTIIDQSDIKGEEGYNYSILMENHEYSDIRAEIFFKKSSYTRKTLWLIPVGEEICYDFRGAILYQNDGKTVIYDENGHVKFIEDCSGENKITFSYENEIKIKDTLGNEAIFERNGENIIGIKIGAAEAVYEIQNNELLKATDVGGREWNYDYEKIKLVRKSELLNPPEGYVQPEEKSYEVSVLSTIKSNGIGYTKLEYEVKNDMDYEDVIESNGEKYKFKVTQGSFRVKQKKEGLSNEVILRTVKYDMEYAGPEEKQFHVKKSSVDDGKTIVKTEYKLVKKSRNRLTMAPETIKGRWAEGNIGEQEKENKQILIYAKKIETFVPFLEETKENEIDEQLMRFTKVRVVKGEGNTITDTYTYDGGNIKAESHTYETGGRKSTLAIERTFMDPIKNRTNLILLEKRTAIGNLSDGKEDLATIVEEKYCYNQNGQITECMKGDGKWCYSYGAYGNLIKTVSPKGRITEYKYNYKEKDEEYSIETIRKNGNKEGKDVCEKTFYKIKSGDVSRIIDADGYETLFEYDILGRMISKSRNNGKSNASVIYDDKAMITKVTDELNCVTLNTFDNLGRLIKIERKGNEKTITTILKYDEYDRVILMSEPSYNNITQDNPGTAVNTYSYDNLGRLLRSTDADGRVISYEYQDVLNIVIQDMGKIQKTLIQKDNMGNVIRTGKWISGNNWDTVNVYYDGEGREICRTDECGRETLTVYNSLGLVSQITAANGMTENREYDADGLPIVITKDGHDGNKIKEEYEYNSFSQMKSKKVPVENADGKKRLYLEEYEYDGRGNVRETKVHYDGSPDIKITRASYRYDGKIESQIDGCGYVTLYEYDEKGNLSVFTDPRNNLDYNSEFFLKMKYDSFGRLEYGWTPHEVVRKDEGPADVVMEYNAQGNVTNRTDRENFVSSYRYTPAGKLESKTEGKNTESYMYDGAGRQISVKGPDGVTLCRTYDASGRIATEKYSGENSLIKYEYNADGTLHKVTDREGNVTEYRYNNLGLIESLTSGNISSNYKYDGLGRKIEQKDGEGNIRTYTYDALNRIIREITPLGYVLKYDYDARGNVTEYIDAAGTKFVRLYSKNDQLIMETVYVVENNKSTPSMVRTFDYDEGGNLKSITEKKGDVNSLPVTVSYNMQEGKYQSNAYGNITSMKWNTTGHEVKYEYDGLNRMTGITTPDGNKNVYKYNENNQIVSMSNFIEGTIRYENSKLIEYTTVSGMTKKLNYTKEHGLVNRIEYIQKEGLSTGYKYSYNNNLNIDGIYHLDTGKNDSFVYDENGRLLSSVVNQRVERGNWISPADTDVVFREIERDLSKQDDNSKYYNVPGKIVFDSKGKSFIYNFAMVVGINRIELYPEGGNGHRVRQRDISILIKKDDASEWKEISYQEWKFSRDEKNGSIHIIFKREINASKLKIHNNWDDRNYLNNSIDDYATFKNTSDKIIRVWLVDTVKTETYGYDGNSGRKTKTEGNNKNFSYEYYKNSSGGNSSMVKCDGIWYYTYDANGNRTSRAKSSQSGNGEITKDNALEYWEYTWDVYNRLIRVHQLKSSEGDSLVDVSYEYDALNFRIRRTSTLEGTQTTYAYGRNGALVYEKTEKGMDRAERSYAYLNDQIIGFRDKNRNGHENMRYTITDMAGSVSEIYDENRKLMWKGGYTAFGKMACVSEDRFEGLFVFNGMYAGSQEDWETGLTYHWNRWRNEEGDSWLSEDPARDGNNWYGYAGQNPIMFLDPNGLNTLDDFNYQKRTEDTDKSVENQRKYDHQAREYALQNQGLTDYGNAIHNNEKFFYDFMDKKFDADNPLNQLDLDRILGYNTTLGTTQSCLLASLYNGYGSQLRNGITGQQIIDTLYDGGNFRKAPDGNPYITFEYDKRSESKAPYIRGDQLGNFSWSISSTLGLSQYIHIGPTERYDSIANDYISMKNGLYGILKMENKKKPGNFHFVYVHDYRIIDSLPENRNKPEYKERTLMLLW